MFRCEIITDSVLFGETPEEEALQLIKCLEQIIDQLETGVIIGAVKAPNGNVMGGWTRQKTDI